MFIISKYFFDTVFLNNFEAYLLECQMGTYKIKELEHLTGIKAHTIRIWEKRYGILTPERSDTLIRQYDDQDMMTILSISLLNKHGYKISRIADMTSLEIRRKIQEMANNSLTDAVHENLLISLLELNESLFRQTLTDLIEKIGLEQTFALHLIPFLEKIGVMWLVGTINPAQEHFISNLIRQKLIVEIDRLPTIQNTKKVILFLPEHENHEISLLFYHYQMKKKGFSTFYLGQSLPFESLLRCIEKVEPDLLVTSWIVAVEGAYIQSFFENLRKYTSIPVYAGGIQIKNHLNVLKNLVLAISDTDDLPEI